MGWQMSQPDRPYIPVAYVGRSLLEQLGCVVSEFKAVLLECSRVWLHFLFGAALDIQFAKYTQKQYSLDTNSKEANV